MNLFSSRSAETTQVYTSLEIKVGFHSSSLKIQSKCIPKLKSLLIVCFTLGSLWGWGQTTILTGTTVDASTITASTPVTINAGGTLNMDVPRSFSSITTANTGTSTISGTEALTITGNIVIAAANTLSIAPTTTAANLNTANLNAQTSTISGAGNLTISTAININGTNNVATTLTISSGFTISTVAINGVAGNNNTTYNLIVNGTLNVSGAIETGATGVKSFTCGSSSLVNYNGTAQTVYVTTYNNLTLSGSGVKTCAVTTVSNDFTLSGTATVTHGADLSITRDLLLNGGTFTTGAFTLSVGRNLSLNGGNLTTTGALASTVNGTTTITTGTITLPLSAGNKTFTGLVTLNGGTLTGASATVVLAAGITNTAGTVTLTGTATMNTTAATFGGTIAISTVSVSTGVAVTNNGTLTVGTSLTGSGTGSLTNSVTGTLNLNGTCSVPTLTNNGNITSTGAGAITSATITNNLNWNMNGTHAVTAFTNEVNGVLAISATPSVATFTTLTTSAAGNTVNYSGAGAQTVKNNTYSNLTLSGSGAKTVTSSVIVSGKLTMAGTATISGSPETSSSILTIDPSTTANIGSSTLSVASLEIGASSTLTSSGSLSISGNFTNNGTLNSTGTVTLTGGAQTISGATAFNNLTINGAGVKTVSSNITIIGTMTLTAGIINVPSDLNKVIFNSGSSVSVNADKLSFIKGFVQKIGNTDFTFPVGGLVNGVNTYRPIVIAGQGGAASASTSFTAKYYEATNAISLAVSPYFKTETPGSNTLAGVSDFEYWDLTPSQLTPVMTANVTLDWSPSLYPATSTTYVSLRLAHLTGTTGNERWENLSGASGPASFASKTITVNGVSSFSPFTMGSISAAALPVTLTSFTAKPTPDNKVSLGWVTSSEQVNKGFRIERQTTAETGKFAQIGFVATKAKDGNSQSMLTYNFIDNAPKTGASSFYRLVQEDLDGKLTYSDIRVVRLNGQSVSMVFPNPSNGVVNISRTADGKKMNIQVIDQSGKIVSQAYNITDANYTMSILQSGIYSVKLMYPETGEQSIQRIVVQR